MVYNPVKFGRRLTGYQALLSASGSTLLTGLVSYWKLDEESGTRVDSHGSNDLTDNNTVGYATGKSGNAASFVEANSEYLSGSWTVTEADYTFSFWIYLTPAEYAALQINVNGAANYTQTVYIDTNTGGRLLNTVYDSSSGTSSAHITGIGTSAAWHHVVVGYDSSSKKAFSAIDGSAITEGAALTNGIKTAGNTLWLGRNAAGFYADILIDELANWSRRLSDDEIAALYASGAGLFYDFSSL